MTTMSTKTTMTKLRYDLEQNENEEAKQIYTLLIVIENESAARSKTTNAGDVDDDVT